MKSAWIAVAKLQKKKKKKIKKKKKKKINK